MSLSPLLFLFDYSRCRCAPPPRIAYLRTEPPPRGPLAYGCYAESGLSSLCRRALRPCRRASCPFPPASHVTAATSPPHDYRFFARARQWAVYRSPVRSRVPPATPPSRRCVRCTEPATGPDARDPLCRFPPHHAGDCCRRTWCASVSGCGVFCATQHPLAAPSGAVHRVPRAAADLCGLCSQRLTCRYPVPAHGLPGSRRGRSVHWLMRDEVWCDDGYICPRCVRS